VRIFSCLLARFILGKKGSKRLDLLQAYGIDFGQRPGDRCPPMLWERTWVLSPLRETVPYTFQILAALKFAVSTIHFESV
jgi:hypothetical protein